MTIQEWRKNDELVAWAGKLFRNPNWRALVEVMDGAHIRHGQLHVVGNLLGPSETDCTRQLGRIEGWDIYHNTLNILSVKEQETGPAPEPTFADPTKEVETI